MLVPDPEFGVWSIGFNDTLGASPLERIFQGLHFQRGIGFADTALL